MEVIEGSLNMTLGTATLKAEATILDMLKNELDESQESISDETKSDIWEFFKSNIEEITDMDLELLHDAIEKILPENLIEFSAFMVKVIVKVLSQFPGY